MSIDPYNMKDLNEETVALLNEVISLIKSRDSESIADLVLTTTAAWIQTEVNLSPGFYLQVNDFWFDVIERITLLVKEQNTRKKIPAQIH